MFRFSRPDAVYACIGCPGETVVIPPSTALPFNLPSPHNTYHILPPLWEQPLSSWHALAPQSGPYPVVLLAAEEYRTWKALPSTFTPARLNPSTLPLSRLQRWLHLGLVRPAGTFPRPANFTLWLQITQACQLDCVYCYVPKRPRFMPMRVARRVLYTFLARARDQGVPQFHLKYAGGEPTLRIRWLARFHRWARQVAGEYGITLTGSVITNGLNLTPQVLDTCRDLGLTLSISWDGPDAAHDGQRLARNRRPTEARVRQAVLRAKAWGFTPVLIMTVTAHNVDRLPEMARFALEHQLPFTFNLYRQPFPGRPSFLIPLEERLIAALEQALETIEAHLDRVAMPLPHLLGGPAGGPGRACGAGHTYFAVGVSGQVRNCHMLLDAHARVGDLTPPPDVRVLHAQQRGECAQCPWQTWCGGGCPLYTYHLTGRWDVPSPYCSVYRIFLPRLLDIEARRLYLQTRSLCKY